MRPGSATGSVNAERCLPHAPVLGEEAMIVLEIIGWALIGGFLLFVIYEGVK